MNGGSVMSGAKLSKGKTVRSLMGLSTGKGKKRPMYGKSKVSKTMREFGKGKLRSGSKKGPVVKSQKQAIAIALNQARKK